jgi:hypothetical protein
MELTAANVISIGADITTIMTVLFMIRRMYKSHNKEILEKEKIQNDRCFQHENRLATIEQRVMGEVMAGIFDIKKTLQVILSNHEEHLNLHIQNKL